MQLKRISIENFKGINKPIVIDLKPITLLFGKNSSGKSSIIQAFHYIREILLEDNISPENSPIGGSFINFGDYKNIIHNHDLNNSIRFEFELSFTEEPFEIIEFEKNNITHFKKGNLDSVFKNIECGKVKLEIAWDQQIEEPYLKSYQFDINNHLLFGLYGGDKYLTEWDRFLKFKKGNRILKFYDHTLLPKEMSDEWNLEREEHQWSQSVQDESIEPYYHDDHVDDLSEDWSDQYDDRESDDYLDDSVNEEDQHLIIDNFSNNEEIPIDHYADGCLAFQKIKVLTNLPKSNTRIQFFYDSAFSQKTDVDIDLVDSPKERVDNNFYNEFISQVVLTPLEILRKEFDSLNYIGPLRKNPPRNFSKTTQDSMTNNWADGMAAYEKFLFADDEEIFEINKWLSNKDKLNTNYGLSVKKSFIIEEESEFMANVRKGYNLDKSAYEKLILNKLDCLDYKSTFSLIDKHKKIDLSTKDVGTGFSQILPILIGSLCNRNSLFAIEQPELHIHPEMQLILGDLFIESALNFDKKNRFLIETHSEHLILRLLKRIKQSNRVMNNSISGISPDDISINFLKRGPNGSIVYKIRVDKRGRFIDSWPGGFFEEDFEELF